MTEPHTIPHSIRLRGPWDYAARDDRRTQSGKMGIPGVLSFDDEFGPNLRVELIRPFNWVAKLAPGESVWLCIDRCATPATVVLNGVKIGRIDEPLTDARFDATSLLRPNNRLTIICVPANVESLAKSADQQVEFCAAVRDMILQQTTRRQSEDHEVETPETIVVPNDPSVGRICGIFGGVYLAAESKSVEPS